MPNAPLAGLGGWRGWALVVVVWAAQLPFVPAVVPIYFRAMISLAVATQLLPALAVHGLPRPVPPARYWIGVWAIVFFISDIGQLLVSVVARAENLWFYLIANPLEDAALLMALSYWQVRPVMRLTFRIAIPLLAIATLALAIGFDEVNTFKRVSSPFRLLFLTTAVAYTLVVRIAGDAGRIFERDWMWTSLGVILYTAAYVVVDPVSDALIPERMDLARLVYVVKAGVDTVAFLMVWKGMRCPTEPHSGSISALS